MYFKVSSKINKAKTKRGKSMKEKDYVLSTSRYKIHKKDCFHLSKIKAEHKMYFDSVEEAQEHCDNRIEKCLHCFYEPKKK